MPSHVSIRFRDREAPNPEYQRALKECMEEFYIRFHTPMGVDQNLLEANKCLGKANKIPQSTLPPASSDCVISFLNKVLYDRPLEELEYIYRTEIKPLIENNTLNANSNITGEIPIDH